MGSLKFLKALVIGGGFSFLLSGCQLTYIVKSGYGQMKLLSSRVPVEEVLKRDDLPEDTRHKLSISQEARNFAEDRLHLKPTKNYKSYVELDRPYVTYVVSAAPKWNLEHYQWSYPFLGKMPYKGYFNEEDAKIEEEKLMAEDLDTFMRGVTAYSTLGWFDDPLLSSMMRYKDYDLVNTIIHETVHATLYIKHAADFNERLASFLGNKGAEYFYLEREGADSKTLQQVRIDNEDSRIFSAFISEEIKNLKEWYKNISVLEKTEEIRAARMQEIQTRFESQIQPQLKGDQYSRFSKLRLNNARLLIYKTYMQNLDEFEQLYQLVDRNFDKFLKVCKEFESAKNPEEALRLKISDLQKRLGSL